MKPTSPETRRPEPPAAARALLAVSAAVLLAACGKSNQYHPPPPPTVTVSKPLSLPVTDYLQSTGSVAASKTVDLVARVEGYLRSADFKDGSLVKAGDLLFVIEPEPYAAKLASQQAQLLNAQSEYERQLRMIKENATSQANVEKWQSQRDQAAAAVTLAKINLGVHAHYRPLYRAHRPPSGRSRQSGRQRRQRHQARHARTDRACLRLLQHQRARRLARACSRAGARHAD